MPDRGLGYYLLFGMASAMADSDNPRQLSLDKIITTLPATRAARPVNTGSRAHWRLVEPAEADQDLASQHSAFCQTSLSYRNPGNDVRL